MFRGELSEFCYVCVWLKTSSIIVQPFCVYVLVLPMEWESILQALSFDPQHVHEAVIILEISYHDGSPQSQIWRSLGSLAHGSLPPGSSVLSDQQNVRPIKELLQTLYRSLCDLVQDMGKSVLVGNISTWLHRMENIMQWHQQLDNIQINRVGPRHIVMVTTVSPHPGQQGRTVL